MTEIIYIYKIVLGKQIYIGSTKDLKKRVYYHRRKFKDGVKYKLYEYMREYGLTINDFKLIIIEECNNENRNERECYYIRQMGTLNKLIPGRLNKDWLKENKEKVRIQRKQHRIEHKEELNLRQREYQIKNKEILKIKQKEYITKNKEKIKIKQKE